MRSHQGVSTSETIFADTGRSNHTAIPLLTFGVEFPALGIAATMNIRVERALTHFP